MTDNATRTNVLVEQQTGLDRQGDILYFLYLFIFFYVAKIVIHWRIK